MRSGDSITACAPWARVAHYVWRRWRPAFCTEAWGGGSHPPGGAAGPLPLALSVDGWRTVHDTQARNPGLGEYVIDLPTQTLPAGARIDFTFYWPEVDRWE